MTKEIRSPNDEKLPVGCRFRHSDFIILSDFVIRHSGLGLAVMGSLDDSKSCIATMNHWRPAPHAKAPINRTHSKRFALPAESADHAPAFGVRASSAPLSEASLRFDGRAGSWRPLWPFRMHWDHEPYRIPLTRPSGTFSPIGGEGWDEGVRFMESVRNWRPC